jgi:hypothetical protein
MYGLQKNGNQMEALMFILVDTGLRHRIPVGSGYPVIGKNMHTVNTGLPVTGENIN